MRRLPVFAVTAAACLCASLALAQQATTPPSRPVAPAHLAGALFCVALAGALWLVARGTTLLRDNMLPQIAPERQTYSLGRWQMAFWFTLIPGSFIAIFILTGHYNGVVSDQAVWLMGISAGSGVAAVAVDVVRDSPADAANRGLIALGLRTYGDVQRTRDEIAQRETRLKANPPPPDVAQLALEIHDRRLLLKAYENAIQPFVSEGWLKDLTTDLNGAALHRVQTLAWTIILGLVFVVEVIENRAMPQFDASLLILLGISNSGYIGFKYPEPQ